MTEKVKKKVLWVDDEIELLSSHILFLQKHGYHVTAVTNGPEALSRMEEESFDAILLDEIMVGMNGLDTLKEIRSITTTTPVIMITKSDEEELMDEGFGLALDDYLIKPVNPKQVVAALKRHLEGEKLRRNHLSLSYGRFYNSIIYRLQGNLDWREWAELYNEICSWDINLSASGTREVSDLVSLQNELRMECNRVFGEYVTSNYRDWIASRQGRPLLSMDLLENQILPLFERFSSVFLIVVDCMRLDQWLVIEPLVERWFKITHHHFYSILPTSTTYSRNSIFVGITPLQIAEKYPQHWNERSAELDSLNRFEGELLASFFKKLSKNTLSTRYIKVSNVVDDHNFRQRISSLTGPGLTALVFNFIDNLTHERSRHEILEEIAPSAGAFRELTSNWFKRSSIMDLLHSLKNQKDCVVVITSDHGSILTERAIPVFGDKTTTKSLRFWYGRNLRSEADRALTINRPQEYGLPSEFLGKGYIIAKEDFNLIYSFNFNEQKRRFKGGFQHGGISLQEMILPCVICEPKGK